MMGDRRGKSLLWPSWGAAIALALADIPAMPTQREDRAWVNELQPGRKRTRSNGEAQWKREQRSTKRSRR